MTAERRLLTLSRGPFVSSGFVFGDATCVAVLQTVGEQIPTQMLLTRDGAEPGRGWPLSEAIRLDRLLKREGLLALFAAVWAEPGRVSVCTAGDIRVHLVQAGRVECSTRDHVYTTDAAGTEDLSRVPREVLARAPTRSVGGTATSNPEAVEWEVSSAYSVIICSAEIHGHGPPSSYLQQLMARDRLPDVEGFMCRIDSYVR